MQYLHKHLFLLFWVVLSLVFVPAPPEFSQVFQPAGELRAVIPSPAAGAGTRGPTQCLLEHSHRSVFDLQLCIQVLLPHFQGHVPGLPGPRPYALRLHADLITADVIRCQPQCHQHAAGHHLQLHKVVMAVLQRPILCCNGACHLVDDSFCFTNSPYCLILPCVWDAAHHVVPAPLQWLTDHGLQPVQHFFFDSCGPAMPPSYPVNFFSATSNGGQEGPHVCAGSQFISIPGGPHQALPPGFNQAHQGSQLWRLELFFYQGLLFSSEFGSSPCFFIGLEAPG